MTKKKNDNAQKKVFEEATKKINDGELEVNNSISSKIMRLEKRSKQRGAFTIRGCDVRAMFSGIKWISRKEAEKLFPPD